MPRADDKPYKDALFLSSLPPRDVRSFGIYRLRAFSPGTDVGARGFCVDFFRAKGAVFSPLLRRVAPVFSGFALALRNMLWRVLVFCECSLPFGLGRT
jgi:hypothetical protein